MYRPIGGYIGIPARPPTGSEGFRHLWSLCVVYLLHSVSERLGGACGGCRPYRPRFPCRRPRPEVRSRMGDRPDGGIRLGPRPAGHDQERPAGQPAAGLAVPAVAGGHCGAEPGGEPGVQPVPVRRQLLRPVRRAVHRAARDSALERGHRGGARGALDRPAMAGAGDLLRRVGGGRIPGRGTAVVAGPHVRVRRAGAGDAKPRRPARPHVRLDLRRHHRLPGQHRDPGTELRLPAVRAHALAGRGGQPRTPAAGTHLAGPPGACAVGEHPRLGADRGGDGRPVRGVPGRGSDAAARGPAGCPRLPRARCRQRPERAVHAVRHRGDRLLQKREPGGARH